MVRYELEPVRHQQPMSVGPFHQWPGPDGNPWILFYRRGADYLLRFPKLADFEVAADGRVVRCRPAPAVTGSTLEHLYLNLVLPLALSRQGRLVLHGSTVEAEGGALAFVGMSGRGKSTLAVGFAADGHRLLSDDHLDVELRGRHVQALPSHSSIRLWEDSRDALIGKRAPVAPPVQFTSKVRFLAGGSLAFCDEPRPLLNLYFLGEDTVTDPVISGMRSRDALIELAKNSFLLDIEARDLVAARFERLVQLARMPIYHRLEYPRRYDVLGDVRAAVLAHAGCRPARAGICARAG